MQRSESRRVAERGLRLSTKPASVRPLPALGREVATVGLSVLFCVGLLITVWESVSLAGVFSPIVLSDPLTVAQAFGAELQSGDLVFNTGVTLEEAFLGFALAAALAAVGGYVVVQLRVLELLVTPFIAASQGIPAVAIAPIILLLLRGDLLPKVIICATVVIFPLLVATITGLRSIGQEYHDVARVFGATRLQRLRFVELPLAAPILLSGLKLGLTLSITGAVVAEFVASDAGLGFMVNTAMNSFEVSTRYVAVITLATLSATLFGLVTLLERIVQQWLGE